ncbi:outer membrane lipoprotein carrier protein LolA [Streptomyces thioluteus]|uniref:Outer membrane lipoprotein carrier protein LolA n=1 Tax=Streptomyces thioluteus TaxID=66431 RepID=A0ABP6J7P1_STRTU
MARIQPTPDAAGPGTSGVNGPSGPGRRKAVRYAVPVAVAGVAAATIGIGSALASSGDPDLPKISAQDLIAKVAASDTQQLSGSVRITTDLGLPAMPSGMSFGGSGAKGGKDASPQDRLTELAAGTHTLRVAADGPERQRVSIVERAAEYSMVRNGDQVWAYDSGSNTAYHAKAPKQQQKHSETGLASASPQELAKKVLEAAGSSTDVAVDGTAKVAGRDAYQLTLKPKQDDTTVGAVRIAVDAKNGVPLKFTLAPKGGGKAVVDVAFTKVSFDKPSASTFSFTPPKGAKVTEGDGKKDQGGNRGMGRLPVAPPGADSGAHRVIGTGWSSIAELSGGGKGKLPKADAKSGKQSADAASLLDSFGSKVSGDFGSGRIVSTRLVNVLLTDDGKVYAGAVTKDALLKAANSAAR